MKNGRGPKPSPDLLFIQWGFSAGGKGNGKMLLKKGGSVGAGLEKD
nr:MAG TPA: hypothetical protein [Caudoviricetes sp.]